MKPKSNTKNRTNNSHNAAFSNIEIVTLAVYLLRGDSKYLDTEDIAVKVNELAPGRFTWRKYTNQINIENVRKRLSDAKNPKKGGFVLGSTNKGWMLTEKGLQMCKKRIPDLQGTDISRSPIDQKQIKWQQLEMARMQKTSAFKKILSENEDKITIQEAEAFFRLDEYIMGHAREKKLNRYLNVFSDDPQMGKIVKNLAAKVRQYERNS